MEPLNFTLTFNRHRARPEMSAFSKAFLRARVPFNQSNSYSAKQLTSPAAHVGTRWKGCVASWLRPAPSKDTVLTERASGGRVRNRPAKVPAPEPREAANDVDSTGA